MGHGDYLEIANMQVLKISDDDFMIVVIIFHLYKDNDFVDDNNPKNCSQQHWPTNTFILIIIPPQPGPATSPTYVEKGVHHHHHRHQDCHQRFLVQHKNPNVRN